MDEQKRLLNAIWQQESGKSHDSEFSSQGLNIYRRNLMANASRSLSISFTTIFELLDWDVSALLVTDFLKTSPPTQGDWAQWGENFPSFIASTELGNQYPYLADCALLDWKIHQALHGYDQVLEQASLQRLADTEPENMTCQFNSNVALINSDYPIADIFDAHHDADDHQRDKAMHRAQQRLAEEPNQQCYLVYRQAFQPMVKVLLRSQAIFIEHLLAEQSLASALDSVSADNEFSFEQWLIQAIEDNLIICFKEKNYE